MRSKDAYWFPHDSNALQDPKIARLVRLHGLEGYGLFWAVIERLREADGHAIKCDSIPDIVYQVRSSDSIFSSLFECELLEKTDDGLFFSPSLTRRMQRWNRKVQTLKANGRKGGEANAQAKVKQKGSKCSSKGEAKGKQKGSKSVPIRSDNRTEQNRTEDQRTEQISMSIAPGSAGADSPTRAPSPAGPNTKSGPTWAAYSEAYQQRYGVPPVVNKRGYLLCCNLVDLVGASEAPEVARWYLSSRNSFYATAGHPLTLLVRDAEKIRTEWASGREVSRRQAQEQERLSEQGESWMRVIEKIKAKEEAEKNGN